MSALKCQLLPSAHQSPLLPSAHQNPLLPCAPQMLWISPRKFRGGAICPWPDRRPRPRRPLDRLGRLSLLPRPGGLPCLHLGLDSRVPTPHPGGYVTARDTPIGKGGLCQGSGHTVLCFFPCASWVSLFGYFPVLVKLIDLFLAPVLVLIDYFPCVYSPEFPLSLGPFTCLLCCVSWVPLLKEDLFLTELRDCPLLHWVVY